MNRLSLTLAGVLAWTATGCLEPAASRPGARFGALLRIHYAGSAHLARDTNAAKLREILALPASAALREQVLNKLAPAPRRFWAEALPTGVPDQAALIRPLLAP